MNAGTCEVVKTERLPSDLGWMGFLPAVEDDVTQHMPIHSGLKWGWRDGLSRTSCSRRGCRFNSQRPHGSPQLSITLVARDPMSPSNFQGHQTPDTCVSKMFTHIKKNPPPPTSWLPLPSPARQYTKGQRLLALCKHPEILNPIIGHSISSNPDVVSQFYKPKCQPAQMPFSICLPRSFDAKPSLPAVISFASFLNKYLKGFSYSYSLRLSIPYSKHTHFDSSLLLGIHG